MTATSFVSKPDDTSLYLFRSVNYAAGHQRELLGKTGVGLMAYLRNMCLVASALVCTTVAPTAASSAPTALKIDFLATGFSNHGNPAPYTDVTGSFTLHFDPDVTSEGVLGDFSSSLPSQYETGVRYGYSSGSLYIGQGASSFILTYPPFSGTGIGMALTFDPSFSTASLSFPFAYAEVGGDQYTTSAVTFRVGNVPEPATWALALIGFGGIGAAMRWRKSAVSFG